MGECLIVRRGGESYKLPVLDFNYPKDVSTTVVKGNNASATFSVVISEPGRPTEYTYQWYVNGSAVSGATGSSYTKSDLSTDTTYSVHCSVTNKKGTVESRVATLKVTQHYTPTLNSSYPKDSTVAKGTSVTSEVKIATAGNPTSYTYQWYKNGSAVSGATSSSYSFTPTAEGTTTVYCKVTNSAGTVSSRTATITATKVYLYNAGNQYTSITGGWKKYDSNVTVTFNSANIRIYGTGVAESVNKAAVLTTNKIDVSSYSKLSIKATIVNIGAYVGYLALTSNNTSYSPTVVSSVVMPAGSTTIDLDVSTITGSYYVAVTTDHSADCTITEISLS